MTDRRPLPTFEGLVTEGTHESFAVFSPDHAYRYALARLWEDYFTTDQWEGASSPIMTFVMLNPSKADAVEPDPTVTRCIGFAKRAHCGGILVVNLFALVSTDPKALLRARDPVGPANERVVHWGLSAPFPLIAVAAWGALSARLHRASERTRAVARMNRGLRCLGKTKHGHPRHPLYLRADTPLEEFRS